MKSLRIDFTLMLNFQEHQNYTIYNNFSLQTEKKDKKNYVTVCLNSKKIVTIISFLLLCLEKFKVYIKGGCSA